MKKLFMALPALLLVTIAWCQVSEQRTPGNFTGISGATGLDITLTAGNSNAVTVSASDQKYIDAVESQVKDGILYLAFKSNTDFKNKDRNKNIKVTVTYTSLNSVKGSSGASIQSTGDISSSSFKLDMNSGATFSGSLKTGSLSVNQSSGAISKVSGTATSVNADMSSGAIFTADNLMAETCTAGASTGAIIKIGVSKNLSASARTGAVINYKGNPSVDKKSTSTGGVISKI